MCYARFIIASEFWPFGLLTAAFCTLSFFPACGPSDHTATNRETPGASQTDTSKTSPPTKENVAFLLNQQGDSLRAIDNYAEAMRCYQMSMDSAATNADSFLYYDSKLDIACVHDRLGELDKAIALGIDVLAAYIRSGDSAHIGRGYATLSAFYGRAQMHEKSMETARKGFEITRQYGSLIERCAAYNQMAFIYKERGSWAEALPLLDSALMYMLQSGVLDQRSAMYLNLGNCHRKLGHWSEAQRYLQQAESLADSLGENYVRLRALQRLSQLAEETGRPAEAFQLFREAATLKDSIFDAEKMENIKSIEFRYQTKEKEQENALLRAEQATKSMQRNLALTLSVFALLFALAIFLRWRESLRRAALETKQHEQTLHEFSQLLLNKNARIAQLEASAGNLSEPPQAPAPKKSELPAAEHDDEHFIYSSRILTHQDWETFKFYFENAHKGYLLRLRQSFPDMSDAEERLFLLIKLNFTRNEAASTLGISTNAIKKGRQRLRKRLGLESEDKLEQFIQQF